MNCEINISFFDRDSLIINIESFMDASSSKLTNSNVKNICGAKLMRVNLIYPLQLKHLAFYKVRIT